MDKTIKLIMKLCSIISGIICVGLSFFIYYLITDKSGPYVETPYMVGGSFLAGVFCILLWILSSKLTLDNFINNLSILFATFAIYFAFTPVITGSNILLAINSGNIFTFYSDKSYQFISTSKIATQAQSAYVEHILMVVVFILITILLMVFKKQIINIIYKKIKR